MVEQPPALHNGYGYIWFAHAIVSAAQAARLEGQLGAVRREFRAHDRSELGDPRHATEVEFWVHPDDRGPAWDIWQQVLAEA